MARFRLNVRLLVGSGRATIIVACMSLSSCGPPNDTTGQTGSTTTANECDEPRESDSLEAFAAKCDTAIGESVPDFDCDAGTEVPETHLTGTYPNGFCDAPNVLNHECDPGSRFQVLKQTNDVTIVGHCRKQAHAPGKYGDIAVIQYNKKNGATCFYQALGGLDHNVPAPKKGNTGSFPWKTPKDTAGIECVHCHDNGPFVRSEYLAQLRNETKNRLPGTNPGAGPWDHRFSWNQTIPYTFVGNDFQSWKTYSVQVTGTGSGCTSCHRLGLSSVGGVYRSQGTAQVFALEATAMAQAHKNVHSADSPIWMTPSQVTYSAANETEAKAIAACANQIVKKGNDPSAPNPPSGCQVTQFGQGSSCRSGPTTTVINGATQSTPSSSRSDTVVDVGGCAPGNPDCPPGFCYWRTVHGPFWQTTPSTIPIGAANYRGSFVQIFAENGSWKSRAFSDPTGGPPNAPPGGTVECTRFNEIVAIPDPNKCFANPFKIMDKDGSQVSGTVNTTVAGASTVNFTSGFVGNVAQANTGSQRDGPDRLQIHESAGTVNLSFLHTPAPPPPLKPGPLTGEAWVDGCSGWTANYAAKDIFTTTDVQLVSAADTPNVRCFVTGVTGAWSSTRNNATIQPFAQIYVGSGKETRLRVSPTSGADSVGAYASCIRLK